MKKAKDPNKAFREMFEHPDPKLLEIMERERKYMGLKTRKEQQKELREMLAEVRRIHADGVRQRAELDARLNEQKDTPTIEELKRTNAVLVSELERLKKNAKNRKPLNDSV